MELMILKGLNWGLSPMTPNAWMRMYMQICTDQRDLLMKLSVLPAYKVTLSGDAAGGPCMLDVGSQGSATVSWPHQPCIITESRGSGSCVRLQLARHCPVFAGCQPLPTPCVRVHLASSHSMASNLMTLTTDTCCGFLTSLEEELGTGSMLATGGSEGEP